MQNRFFHPHISRFGFHNSCKKFKNSEKTALKQFTEKPCAKSNNKQNTMVNFRIFSLTFLPSKVATVVKLIFVLTETVLLNFGNFLLTHDKLEI